MWRIRDLGSGWRKYCTIYLLWSYLAAAQGTGVLRNGRFKDGRRERKRTVS